jgi:hypothetical protein
MKGLYEIQQANNNHETYRIVRHYQDGTRTLVSEGNSLQEAQFHCNQKDTSGPGWFDGYEVE